MQDIIKTIWLKSLSSTCIENGPMIVPLLNIKDQVTLHCSINIIMNYYITSLLGSRSLALMSTCTIRESALIESMNMIQ
jgi:hypothetical protein